MSARPPIHGGDLIRAEKELGIRTSDCLDLSTGISPWAYPVGAIPESVWQTLPYGDSALLTAAGVYYSCPASAITPVAGSQDAIRRLPRLLATKQTISTVALPYIAYQEHKLAWQAAGHELVFYKNLSELKHLVKQGKVKHIVIVNPNNPSAELYQPQDYLSVINDLPETGYCLIDEAFIDLYPESSFTHSAISSANGSTDDSANNCIDDTACINASTMNTKVIVLRSIGKFFGLAGLRLGFVLGCGSLVEHLRNDIMPWGVSHPALWVGTKALGDCAWQSKQIKRIDSQQQYLKSQLDVAFPNCNIATRGLFTTVFGDKNLLHNAFLRAAKANILLRYDVINDKDAWLRFGLPGQCMPLLQAFFSQLYDRND